jgi:hypothetical protein
MAHFRSPAPSEPLAVITEHDARVRCVVAVARGDSAVGAGVCHCQCLPVPGCQAATVIFFLFGATLPAASVRLPVSVLPLPGCHCLFAFLSVCLEPHCQCHCRFCCEPHCRFLTFSRSCSHFFDLSFQSPQKISALILLYLILCVVLCVCVCVCPAVDTDI